MELRPHPRNVDFHWRAPEGAYRRISDAQAESWSELGFFVLEDAFSDDEIDAVVAEIDPWEARVEAFLQTQEDGRAFIARSGEITFSTHLVTRSPLLRDFVSGPVFRDLAHDLIGPDARLYWDQAVYKKPGARDPFPWHQDNGYTYLEPQQYVTCWIALTDADERNGCPRVLPGLHRRGTLAHRLGPLGFVCVDDDAGASVAAPVRKGGIVVFSSLTPHATGPNETEDVRKAYIVQLAPDGALAYPHGSSGEAGVPCDTPERQFPILVGGRPPDEAVR
jgi:ectoine hydroxylase-related dioxygenase (phytanoyl-CoA dioxygenase family)